MENNNPENSKNSNNPHESSEAANSGDSASNANKASSISNSGEASMSIRIKNMSPNSSPNSKSNLNSYTRTYDAHTTDDSDSNELNAEHSSGAKQKRNNLKHKNSRNNNYYHHHHHHHNINFENSSSKFNLNSSHFQSHQSQYSNFYNFKNSKTHAQSFQPHKQLVQQSTGPKVNSSASQNGFIDSNSNSSDASSLIKPCLVHKSSLTSDEEISSSSNNNNGTKPSQSLDKSENKLNDESLNAAKQGILKQNSAKNALFGESERGESVLVEKSGVGGGGGGNNSNITLLVDDTRFIVDPEIFKQHSNTMLGRMFNSALENKPNERGEYVVAYGISSSIFKAVLDFYKHGIIKCPPNVSVQELKEACDYLLIPFDGTTVRCHDLRGLLNE
jgi:hypothetical protein